MAVGLSHEEAHQLYCDIADAHETGEVDWPVTDHEGYEDVIVNADSDRILELDIDNDDNNMIRIDDITAHTTIDTPWKSAEDLADEAMLKLREMGLLDWEGDHRQLPNNANAVNNHPNVESAGMNEVTTDKKTYTDDTTES